MIPVAGTGLTGKDFIHYAEFSSTIHYVSWSQTPHVLLLCSSVPCIDHHTWEAPVGWDTDLEYFQILKLFFLERTNTAKCGPIALSNTQPEAWGSLRFGHK